MGNRVKSKSLFAKVCLTIGATGIALSVIFAAYLFQGNSDGTPLDIVIPKGASISKVVRTLHEQGVVQYPTAFKLLLRITQGASRVRHGEFRFSQNMPPLRTLRVLYMGDPVLHPITIPEGWRALQIADEIERLQLGDKDAFLAIALSKEAAQKRGLSTPSLEGFLFPDTYFFSRTEDEKAILDAMVVRFFEKFKPYEAEAKRKEYSLEKLVTLASIVEKETGAPEERPMIASVFTNRLKKNMRLESDPTTIYGVENFDGNLTKKHLQTRTPYNTYRIRGLPIGPICNPGEDAIKAVLRPDKTEYLFFVSRNDGTHVFTETYKEHRYYVDLHQRGIRRRKP